jgi:hypothetical protein
MCSSCWPDDWFPVKRKRLAQESSLRLSRGFESAALVASLPISDALNSVGGTALWVVRLDQRPEFHANPLQAPVFLRGCRPTP